MDEGLFYQVAPKGDGRVHDVVWGGRAVGRLGTEDGGEEEGEGEDVLEGVEGEGEGLVEQMGGSMRFRDGKDSFVEGCRKAVSKLRRFW